MRALIACIVALLASPLHAQEKVETSETRFYFQTSGGTPTLCGFDAILIYRDYTSDGAD